MYKFKLLEDILENDENIENSKFFGSPVFPENFLENNNVENDFFLLQLNLKEFEEKILPADGYLYFFLDLSTARPKPKVFYTNLELVEIYEDINEDFNMESSKALFIKKDDNTNNLLFENKNDEFILLQINVDDVPLSFPRFNLTHGLIKFIIKKDDLKIMNFLNVSLQLE